MLKPNAVKAKLASGQEAFGLFCSLPVPQMVEMIGCAGYDFVILDTEHALVDPETLENLVRAAEAVGLTPFVRVPEDDAGAILRALDAGALGVVVPHVRSADDAAAAVRAARYYPEGERSLNGGRPAGFGAIPPQEYIRRANAEVMVVALVEDAEGVAAIEEILAVPGLDMVMPGPGDLSQSYGVPWQTRHPAVLDAVARLADACFAAGVPFCPIARSAASIERWRTAGVRAFSLGEDRDLAAGALRANRRLAEAVPAETPSLAV